MDSHLAQENENLSRLGNTPKVPLTQLAEKLPPDAKSVLYEREHYDRYLAITIETLKTILHNYRVRLMRNPLFIYCDLDHMNGWFYAIDIQFDENQWDQNDTESGGVNFLRAKVTDRNIEVPTWIIVLRQQLVFTAVLPIDPHREDKWRILIDFRRVPPPFWVKEKKISHLLDDSPNIRALIEEQYAKISEAINKTIISSEASEVPTVVNTTMPSMGAAPPPRTTATSATRSKQANLSDLFGKLQKKKPAVVEPPVPEVDAMDIDEPPPAPAKPSHSEQAMMELSHNPEAEAYLALQFHKFFNTESRNFYIETDFYCAYQRHLTKLLAILQEHAHDKKKIAFCHQLISECFQTKKSASFEDIYLDPNAQQYCVLSNKLMPNSKLCHVVFPQTQTKTVITKDKLKLIDTFSLSAYLLDQIMKEKAEFILAKPDATVDQIQAIGNQWQKQFLMTLRLLATLVEQACAK